MSRLWLTPTQSTCNWHFAMLQKEPCILHRQFGCEKDCCCCVVEGMVWSRSKLSEDDNNIWWIIHSLQFSQLAIATLQCNKKSFASFHTNWVAKKTFVVERSKSFVFPSFNVKQTWDKFHCSLPLWSIQLLSVTCSFSFSLCFGVFVREQQNKQNKQ